MSVQIQYVTSVGKTLKNLDRVQLKRIAKLIDSLKEDPRPNGKCKHLAAGLFRVRAGDYRVIYYISEDRPLVLIVAVRHRDGAYDDLPELIKFVKHWDTIRRP